MICLFSGCLVRFLFWRDIDGSGCRTWYRAHLCIVCCCCSALQVSKQTDKKLVSQSNKAKELTIYQFRQNARNLSLSSVNLCLPICQSVLFLDSNQSFILALSLFLDRVRKTVSQSYHQ